jgi:hypothetical protein
MRGRRRHRGVAVATLLRSKPGKEALVAQLFLPGYGQGFAQDRTDSGQGKIGGSLVHGRDAGRHQEQ